MSSQSFNATVYSNFTTSADKTGISSGFPLRDGSDFTNMLKRRSVYREFKNADPFSGSPSPLYPVRQSSQTNLQYRFGRVQCKTAGCTGGAFPTTPLGV
jgi:hypothetical protein